MPPRLFSSGAPCQSKTRDEQWGSGGRPEAPRWWPLVTVPTAGAHCPVLILPALPCHKISVSSMDFAFKLYRPLALDAPGENILFSPASVSSALAMLVLGVPAASRAQLLEGEIQEGFQDLLLKPSTQKCIHEYVEEQTQGKCGARAEELGTETAAVLVNHMLLRAGYVQPCDPHATSPKDFFGDEHRAVQGPR
ncbi:unnamed protein product [Nyctereutes procyonoides]|uniref:(raccoon dog) hypothetical protein n=1 Tax=Nyctereutes procyonoides TaxID=34880 RepID=A0A811ZIU0_NYCPR|nr:unnamed protein product [Nyctereutes procyonoides]